MWKRALVFARGAVSLREQMHAVQQRALVRCGSSEPRCWRDISHVGDVKVFLLDRLKGVAINSALAFALCVVAVTAHALPIVAPLFTGASPEIETTGIAKLNERLEREFRNAYDGQVFNPLQVAQARDFVAEFNTTPEFNLVSIGFSIGAESVRALSSC
jgi:hypothetical protein